MKCPLCATDLPASAVECSRCDWVAEPAIPEAKGHTHNRDLAAVYLSVVPGLGHVYKGHLLLGGLILLVIAPAVLIVALYLLPATLGLSLSVPLIVLLGVMAHAYHVKDRRAEAIAHARGLDHRAPLPMNTEEPKLVPETARH